MDCVTVSSDKHKPCVFPVLWKGEYHDKCVKQGSTGKTWCATELKDSDEYKRWGHCGDSCPKEEWTIKSFLRNITFWISNFFLFLIFFSFLIVVPILVFYFVILCISFQFSFLFLVKLCWYNQNMTSKSIQKNYQITSIMTFTHVFVMFVVNLCKVFERE